MNRKSLVSIIVLIVLGFSALAIVLPITSSPAVADPDPRIIDEGFRHQKLPIDQSSADFTPETALKVSGVDAEPEIGAVKRFLVLDDYMGYYFFDNFKLRGIGEFSEVWVQIDLSYPDGDPRNTPGAYGYPEVTDEQVNTLITAFDTNIYPKEIDYYGVPDFHDGSNSYLGALGYPDNYLNPSETGRSVVMVSNVRDDAYYDPTYPNYIAGFYSPTFEFYYDRNIMTLDSHDWINRIGPDGTRPYLYEGVFAHEYQHLIHDDFAASDDNFINEGFSDYAALLAGYPEAATGHINDYLESPDNSLTEWGDQGGVNILRDYGAAALFTVYLEDHFPGLQRKYLENAYDFGVDNQAGIEQAIVDLGFSGYWTFDNIFRAWRIANLIHSHNPGHGIYDYKSIDLDDFSPLNTNLYDGSTFTGASNSYGTTYLVIDEDRGNPKLSFDGNEQLNIDWWTQTDGVWYTGTNQDLWDHSIVGTTYVDPSDTNLVFDTYYDIEDYWDFGFVQVSTDGGATWTSLANEYTTSVHDPNAHPDIIANLPGLTSWSAFEPTSEEDGSILDMTFDLSPWAGQNVLLGFHYMTDWGTTYEGWYVWDVTVSGVPVALANVPVEVEYMVSLVQVIEHEKSGKTFNIVQWDLQLNPATQTGTRTLWFFDWHKWNTYYVAIISPMMSSGTGDFTVDVSKGYHHPRCGF